MCWKCLLQRWWVILPVFLALCYFAIQDKWPDIEADLQASVATNVNVNGLDEVGISFRGLGRVGKLTGKVESTQLRDQAVSLTRETYGVSGVIDQISVIAPTVAVEPESNQLAIAGQIILDGVVSSAAERDILVSATIKRFGAGNVVDNIVISESVVPQQWFSELVDQLNVNNGMTTISVEGDSVTVTGIVESEEVREQVLADLRARVGDSYRVIDDITVEEFAAPDNLSAAAND